MQVNHTAEFSVWYKFGICLLTITTMEEEYMKPKVERLEVCIPHKRVSLELSFIQKRSTCLLSSIEIS